MGLRDGADGSADPPGHRGLVVGLALALLLVSFPPPTSAEHGDVGVSTEPWLADCENEDWLGFRGQYGFAEYRFCFFVDVEGPTYTYDLFEHVQIPPNLQRDHCPEGFHGQIFAVGETRAGLCFNVVHRIPQQPWWIHVGVDLSSCEVPGPEEGEDPAILVADGGVAVCLVPVLEPGPGVPNASASPEPCEPKTVDPEVRVGGGRVEVCMDFFLLTIGSEHVNDYVQQTNETVHETRDEVVEFVGANNSTASDPLM